MAASDPTAMKLSEARDALRGKAISARELVQAHLGTAEAAKALNVYLTLTPEEALRQAGQAAVGLLREDVADQVRPG